MPSDAPIDQEKTDLVRSDEAFVAEALLHLDQMEPSAALLRRVARIPLDLPAVKAKEPLFSSWGTRALLFGALGLGVLAGVVPWEAESTPTGETELESTLSAALGVNWDDADLALEELL